MSIKNIKINSLVKIISGKDKGKIGKVIKIYKRKFIYVENIKLVKKHKKFCTNKNIGGIIDIESKIHISNVCIYK